MFASLSVYGLWEWDNTLFDNMVLPEGLTDHRQDLISEILLDCSDFSLLYPDFDFMKMLIGVWSRNEQRIWEKMLESELIEFNPIENYDRYETLSRTTTGRKDEDSAGSTSRADRSSETGSAGRLETGSASGSTGTSRSEATSSESSRSGQSSSTAAANADNRSGQTAYDTDTIKDTARAVSTSANSGSSTETGSDRSAGINSLHETGDSDSSDNRSTLDNARRDSDSSSIEHDSSRRTGTETGMETVVNHMHGNIGVTTAAEMLAGFRDISNFCTVKFIVDSFKDRFCVQVY